MNRHWILATGLAVLVVGAVGCSSGDTPDGAGLVFEPERVLATHFPAIKDAPIVTAEKAGRGVGPDDLVLGVVVGDVARAYPINMLTGPTREIINDTLGGKSIAATW